MDAKPDNAAKRDVRWDLLRSLAMFAVVVVHAAARIGEGGGLDLSEGVSTFFLVCDPVFFALSGYFAIRPLAGSLGHYYKNKLIGVIVPVVLYSVVAYLVASGLQGLSFAGWLEYLDYLLTGAWWFVPALVPMLAMAPFLYKMFEALDDAAFKRLAKVIFAFVLWGLACDVLASLGGLEIGWAQSLSSAMGRMLPAGSQLFGGYSLYFCMGYAIRRFAPRADERRRRSIVVIGFASLLADAMAAQLGLTRSNPSYLWVFATPAVFALVSHVNVGSQGLRRALEWTSRRSYSIYLFQAAAVVLVGELVYGRSPFGDVALMSEPARVLVWLLFTLAAYALSWLAASVLDMVLLAPVQRVLRSVLGCAK